MPDSLVFEPQRFFATGDLSTILCPFLTSHIGTFKMIHGELVTLDQILVVENYFDFEPQVRSLPLIICTFVHLSYLSASYNENFEPTSLN